MPTSSVEEWRSLGHVYHLVAAMEKPARRRRARRVLALAAAVVGVARWAKLSPVRVEGDSMAPTLPDGALVAVSPLRDEPALGAVVVVRRPDGSEHLKRVTAIPGDAFRTAGRDPLVVRDGELALVGDNAGRSIDSRHYGPVAIEDIVAVARFCYWPPPAWRRLPGGR